MAQTAEAATTDAYLEYLLPYAGRVRQDHLSFAIKLMGIGEPRAMSCHFLCNSRPLLWLQLEPDILYCLAWYSP